MPISCSMQKYPICDTDIWIKSCRLKKEKELFKIYNKIFFANAVVGELKNKKDDDNKLLAIGYNLFREYKDKCYMIEYENTSYFNSKERKVVKRLFNEVKINYNEETKLFSRDEHVGELVSLIYASILRLNIMLSDDKGTKGYSKKIRNRFKSVKVINLIDFLQELGINKEMAVELEREVSEPPVEVNKRIIASRQLEKSGCIKDINLIKHAMILKGKMK